jgi:hypothetical protein
MRWPAFVAFHVREAKHPIWSEACTFFSDRFTCAPIFGNNLTAAAAAEVVSAVNE